MKPQSPNGYTLAELLVVLALLGMIAIAMSGGMQFGARLWEKSVEKSDQIEDVAGAQALLRTLFQRIIPRDLDPGIPADPYLFRATTNQMTFMAASPAAIHTSEMARFELSIVERGARKSLRLVWKSLSGTRQAQNKDLVENAQEISFMFATLDQSGALVWSNEWIDQSGAPALLLIRVRYSNRPAGSWPELIVRPRISREPTCIFDPVSFGCRHA